MAPVSKLCHSRGIIIFLLGVSHALPEVGHRTSDYPNPREMWIYRRWQRTFFWSLVGPGFYIWISICFLPSICLPLFVAPDSLIDCSHCICHRISSSIPISHAYCCGCQMIIHSDFLQFLKSGLFLPLIAPHLCILLPAAFLSIPILSIMLWTKPPVGKIAFSVSKASHCPFKNFGTFWTTVVCQDCTRYQWF